MKIIKAVPIFLLALLFSGLALSQGASSEPPAVLAAVAPLYPVIAQVAKASGDVLVDVEIDKAGKVTSVHVLNAHELLRAVSDQAARRWEFAPGTASEKRRVQLTFSFRIVSEKAAGLDRSPVFYPPYRVEVKSEHLVSVNSY